MRNREWILVRQSTSLQRAPIGIADIAAVTCSYYETGVGGRCAQYGFDPPSGYWCASNPPRGTECVCCVLLLSHSVTMLTALIIIATADTRLNSHPHYRSLTLGAALGNTGSQTKPLLTHSETVYFVPTAATAPCLAPHVPLTDVLLFVHIF